MGLGVQIGKEFLKLKPGTKMELEQENPYLQFDEGVKGDVSIPFDVDNDSDGINMRLLKYASVLQQRVKAAGIDAIVYDDQEQHSRGKIRIERPQIHLNRPTASKVSCFYLSGVSSFFKDIQDIKLRSIDMGGVRSFPMTNLNRTGSAGFWQHIHQVIDAPVGAYDYAFFPVINYSWTSGFASDVLNAMEYTGGTINFKQRATKGQIDRTLNPIVPFPYLHIVLKKAIEHVGWQIQGDILNDADFKKIVLLSFRAIDWRKALNQGKLVSFNLADGLPNMPISTFLIWLKNRFGWAYDFDRKNKVILIRPITTIGQVVKDFTEYVNPVITKSIPQEKKGFRLTNNWNGATPSEEFVSLTGLIDKGIIDNGFILPAPGPAYENWAYLVAADNNYYACLQDLDTGNWSWELLAPNVYDYQDAGDTVEITTGACAVGSGYWNSYMVNVPHLDMDGHWPGPSGAATNPNWSDDKNDEWGVYLTFYHGVRNNWSGQPLPFASSHIYDPNAIQVGNWSLAFQAKKQGTHEEVGLVRIWNQIGGIFRSEEQLELSFNLPRDVYRNLKFSDGIVVNGVRMYISKMRSTIPYSGVITCECIRI